VTSTWRANSTVEIVRYVGDTWELRDDYMGTT
jgi:hypothetical protein